MTPVWILEPHDGDFGMSSWTRCEAPTCVAESYAIVAGEWHFHDQRRFQHVHVKCAGKMVREGIAVIQTEPAVA